MDWQLFRKRGVVPMRPYIEGEDLTGVSLSPADQATGHPKPGDMIARNPQNHTDQWLVSRAYFDANYEPC